LSQTFSANAEDKLQFDYKSSYYFLGSATSDVDITLNGTILVGVSNTYNSNFVGYSYTIPNSGNYTLTFDLTVFDYSGSSYNGTATLSVDNVRLTSVPEPGTLALLATAFAGLLFYARRRRK
jgi:hypothetical protein